MRLAKIIATLGPGSQDSDTIRRLIEAGVNIIRLNFSHGQHDILTEVVQNVRRISHEMGLPVAILGDLQGPKFRIGELEGHRPILLEVGATVRFAADTAPGNTERLTTAIAQIIEELSPGEDVLLNDGAIVLHVTKRISPTELECRVVVGGPLGEKKGINVPGLSLPNLAILTDKDKVDAKFAIEQGVDYLALSFVRSAGDIRALKEYIQPFLKPDQIAPQIVSKIEKPQALDDIDNIIAETDALMVARGDLGVELRAEKVPTIQKMLISKCNAAEKPVITATQMLESMIASPVPTRAEVSDVANAVFDGSDALMLSGETAVGKFPDEAVRTMARIIVEAESHYREWHHRADIETYLAESTSDHTFEFHQAIAQAACYAAQKAQVKAIVVLSISGKMARRISKRKPQLPIIALTTQETVYRQLNLLWGAYPVLIDNADSAEALLSSAEHAILAQQLLTKSDAIVFCAGTTPLRGMTNSLKLDRLEALLDVRPPSSSPVAAVAASAASAR